MSRDDLSEFSGIGGGLILNNPLPGIVQYSTKALEVYQPYFFLSVCLWVLSVVVVLLFIGSMFFFGSMFVLTFLSFYLSSACRSLEEKLLSEVTLYSRGTHIGSKGKARFFSSFFSVVFFSFSWLQSSHMRVDHEFRRETKKEVNVRV